MLRDVCEEENCRERVAGSGAARTLGMFGAEMCARGTVDFGCDELMLFDTL